VRGIETNLPFHRRCVRHPSFLEGEFDTGFIAREHARLVPQSADVGEALEAAVVALALEATAPSARKPKANGAANGQPAAAPTTEPSTWRTGARGWRG
jgi:acetyl/propionyl-CoA carboxylase alpha subunit